MKKVLFLWLTLLYIHGIAKEMPSSVSDVGIYDYFEVNVPSTFLQEGAYQTWNLCNLEQGLSKKMEIFLNQDSCMNIVFDGNIHTYRNCNNSIDLISQEHPTSWLSYSLPIKRLLNNSILGSMDSCAFEAKGKYCGKNVLTKKGTFIEKVDAEGIMVLESSDTLSNIYRKHRSILSDIAIFEDSTENAKPTVFNEKDEYYLWYHKDCFVPIFIQNSKTLFKDGDKVFCEKIAYLMDKDEMLFLEKKHKEDKKCGKTYDKRDSPISSHAISFDNESRKLHITIRANQPIKVSVLVSTTDGVLMLHRQMDCGDIATNEDVFDCSALPRGQYAISLQVGKYIEAEKFIIR